MMRDVLPMLLAAVAVVAAQDQQPVFRGATDVVVVDVQVTDKSGAPVDGLALGDFALKVDGKPRPIVSVTRHRVADAPAATNALPDAAPVDAESYVLVLADPAVMSAEPSRALFEQAAAFVTNLPAAHAVGVMIAPARRPQYPFGALRGEMAAALRRQTGTLRGQPMPAEDQASLDALIAGIGVLRGLGGRRSLVYFADKLRIDPTGLVLMANVAGVSIHVVASDPLVIPDVAARRPAAAPIAGEYGRLAELADLTGGLFLKRATVGSAVLPRIADALSAQYVLTFDVDPADKDRPRHRIEVKVARSGVVVHCRQEFVR